MNKTFKEFVGDIENCIEVVLVTDMETEEVYLIEEGKSVSGRFDWSLRVDQPSHGTGQVHAHIFGRNRNKQIGVVNLDGSVSHNHAPGKLHKKDADALRGLGFSIPANNIVEFKILIGVSEKMLLG